MTPHRSLLLLALALAMALTACTADDSPDDDPSPAATEAATGEPDDTATVDTLRLGGGEFGFPSPFGWRRGPGRIYASLSFDTLLWRDSSGEEIPWLASDWSVSDDGTEWRFTLRDDVQWHDGEALTVEDVVFTYDYLRTGAASDTGEAQGYDVIESVTADGDEVVFQLSQNYAGFAEDVVSIFGAMIIPEHIWADVDDPVEFREPEALVGTGPYTLEEFDENAGSYLFEANDDFYLGDPVVQRLEFVPVEDELLALERGDIDAGSPFGSAIPESQVDTLTEDYDLLTAPGANVTALHFNPGEGAPFDDQRFRQAVAYALDRQDLVDRVLLGRGTPGSMGGLGPGNPYLVEDLPSYDHDPEQAGELLDEAGLVDADDDGVRELPNGDEFAPEVLVSADTAPEVTTLVQEYLREVGLEVEVASQDQATFDETASAGDYAMGIVSYGGLGGDPDFILRFRFASDVESSSFNRAHNFDNEQFNELAAEQATIADRDERQEVVGEMQRILAEEVPIVPLFIGERLAFVDREVFDAWYFTPGCPPCGATRNKHALVTGRTEGFAETP